MEAEETGVQFTFSGTVFEWRGPAPYQFVAVPDAEAELLREMLTALTYGWGMIPVRGQIGATEFTTSMWPRNGGYVLPLKVAVRRADGIDLDDQITVRLEVDI